MTSHPSDLPQLLPTCTICRIYRQVSEYKPFCSKRCADVDLHRWLGGIYAVPSEADAEEDEMPSISNDNIEH